MILGIDIGGTNTRLVLYDCEDFRVLDKILSSQKNIEGLSGRINRIVESYGITR